MLEELVITLVCASLAGWVSAALALLPFAGLLGSLRTTRTAGLKYGFLSGIAGYAVLILHFEPILAFVTEIWQRTIGALITIPQVWIPPVAIGFLFGFWGGGFFAGFPAVIRHGQNQVVEADEAQLMERLKSYTDTDSASYHRDLGALYYHQGQYREAEAPLKLALELDPTFAEAHADLGNVYHKLGNLEDAANHFRIAEKLFVECGKLNAARAVEASLELVEMDRKKRKPAVTPRVRMMDPWGSQKQQVSALAIKRGYGDVVFRVDEIEVVEEALCLAFAVFPEPAWPHGSDLHLAGQLVRAWIALHLGEIAAKEPGLHCDPVYALGSTAVISDIDVKLPRWNLQDSKGQTGPLQVMYSEDPGRGCLYVQIGGAAFSLKYLPDQDYFRLLDRLGEAFKRHCKRFPL